MGNALVQTGALAPSTHPMGYCDGANLSIFCLLFSGNFYRRAYYVLGKLYIHWSHFLLAASLSPRSMCHPLLVAIKI